MPVVVLCLCVVGVTGEHPDFCAVSDILGIIFNLESVLSSWDARTKVRIACLYIRYESLRFACILRLVPAILFDMLKITEPLSCNLT